MKSIVILALFAFALSSNVIMVGDSRTYLLVQYLFNFGYGYNVIETVAPLPYPKDTKKHMFRFDCMPGARIYEFQSNQPLGIFLDQLLATSPGSYAFLWVGINNVASQQGIIDTFHKYVELAQKFPGVQFIVFSIPGVDETKSCHYHPATNAWIRLYNDYMKTHVTAIRAYYPNIRYGSFVDEARPWITVDGVDITPFLDEQGLHFNAEACKYFLDKMMQFLPDN